MSILARELRGARTRCPVVRVAWACFRGSASTSGRCSDASGSRIKDDPVDSLVQLFIDGRDVAIDRLKQHVSAAFLETVLETGLAEEHGSVLNPDSRLFPCYGKFIVTDRACKNTSFNQVMWLWGESYILGALVKRNPRKRAIDIGTGSGVHAILASEHCQSVVAADISPRALEFARFNCALNAIANVECVLSDLFDSIEGTCDLLLANPPYLADSSSRAEKTSGAEASTIPIFCARSYALSQRASIQEEPRTSSPSTRCSRELPSKPSSNSGRAESLPITRCWILRGPSPITRTCSPQSHSRVTNPPGDSVLSACDDLKAQKDGGELVGTVRSLPRMVAVELLPTMTSGTPAQPDVPVPTCLPNIGTKHFTSLPRSGCVICGILRLDADLPCPSDRHSLSRRQLKREVH